MSELQAVQRAVPHSCCDGTLQTAYSLPLESETSRRLKRGSGKTAARLWVRTPRSGRCPPSSGNDPAGYSRRAHPDSSRSGIRARDAGSKAVVFLCMQAQRSLILVEQGTDFTKETLSHGFTNHLAVDLLGADVIAASVPVHCCSPFAFAPLSCVKRREEKGASLSASSDPLATGPRGRKPACRGYWLERFAVGWASGLRAYHNHMNTKFFRNSACRTGFRRSEVQILSTRLRSTADRKCQPCFFVVRASTRIIRIERLKIRCLSLAWVKER